MEAKTVNIYKVIPTTGISNISFGSGMSSAAKSQQKQEAKVYAAQLEGINRIGLSLNGISKTLHNIKQLQLKRLKTEQKARLKDSFTARYTKSEKLKGGFSFTSGVLGRKAPDLFGGLLGFLGGLLKYFVLKPVLEWLANPENQQKVKNILEGVKKIVDFFAWLVKSAVVTFIDGLYDLLRDDATPWQRMTGFLKAFAIIGAAFIGLKFLSSPGKTLKAFRTTLTNFNKGLTSRKKRLEQARNRRGLRGGRRGPRGKSKGGYIDGPMGGYPVSLDGRGVDFIGHGREFVARKPGGGAFVIPFETPDTIKDPGLTDKRIAQAMKGGYNLKEMSSGGWINGPESGYLGSFTGARPEFIGHGLEYVTKNATGDSMVIPFNSSGMTRANMELAHLGGFKLPTSLPKSTGYSSGNFTTAQGAGKSEYFLGSIGKAIGGLFGGGKKSSGGGGGGFFSSIGNAIGGLFGGGSKPASSATPSFAPSLKFGGFGDSNPFLMGQDYSYAQNNADIGNIFNIGMPKTMSTGFNLFSGKSNYIRGVTETSGLGPLANGTQYAAMLTGSKLFGFDYNQDGGIKGGLGGIIRGLSRQGGALGSMIGGLFGAKGTGNAIGNMFQTILGGGGSNEDGSANWWDIIRGGAGIGFQFLEGKKIFGMDAQDFINGSVNLGDLIMNPGKTFGEKLPEMAGRILQLMGKENFMGGKLPHLLAVATGQASPLSLLSNSQQKAIGQMMGAMQSSAMGTDAYGMEGATGEDGQIALDGGGPKKAKEIGRDALTQGLTVFNNPYFRRNNWSEEGPNTKGYSPGGREAVSSNPVHAQGLAIDIASYQGDKQKQESAMKSFAEQLFAARQNLKLQSILYNNWGAWQYGKKRKSPGNYGVPHLHVAVAQGKVANPLSPEGSTGEMTNGQYQQMRNEVTRGGGGGGLGGTLGALAGSGGEGRNIGNNIFDMFKDFFGGNKGKEAGPGGYTLPDGSMPKTGGSFSPGGSGTASPYFGGGAGTDAAFRFGQGGSTAGDKKGGGLGSFMPLMKGSKAGTNYGSMMGGQSDMFDLLFGGKGTRTQGAGLSRVGQNKHEERQAALIAKVTRDREYARTEMNQRSQATVQQTMAAVEAANARVRAAVAAAQSAVANLAAGQGARGGQITGNSGNKITQSVGAAMAGIINSGMNSGGGIFS